MLTTSQPEAENHADSARVEKRGPWMTTTVPPSRTGIPSAPAESTSSARSSGQYGSAAETCVTARPAAVVERVRATARPVDELVADDELPARQIGPQRARRARADDAPHPELPHRPHVRPVRHAVRRQLVPAP